MEHNTTANFGTRSTKYSI